MNKICIIGSEGMLGRDVKNLFSSNPKYECIGFNHKEIDITDIDSIERNLDKHDINYIINCAAITDTTYCGTNEGMILSYKVNVKGVRNLGMYCKKKNIHFIHISTDAVYSEFCDINMKEFPVNIYGTHKLIAEREIHNIMDYDKYSILRCSWIYGKTQNKKNFIEKILGFCEKSKDGTIKVVDDCFGRPTSTIYVALFIEQCIELGQYGIIDCQTYNKPISRYDFANMIKKIYRIDNIEIINVTSDYFKNCINQNKLVPIEFTDESKKLKDIIKHIEHNSDYEYWIQKYYDSNL